VSRKKKFPEGSVCKPCWELKYCPYGFMVEWSPFAGAYDLEEVKDQYAKLVEKFLTGSIQSEDELISDVDRLLFLSPGDYEYLSQFDPKEINCTQWGHACPVFIYQSGATETEDSRRDGRYLPRDLMLKVVRRDDHRCQQCFRYVQDKDIEFDHVIPLSRGGPTTAENIRLLCRRCNRKKNNSVDDLLAKK